MIIYEYTIYSPKRYWGANMSRMKEKVLITGVAGLIGSHFSEYLLDKGYNVVGVDDLSGGCVEFVDNRLIKNGKFYKYNLMDKKSIDKIFKENKFDYVYHFAAYAAEGLSPFIRNYNYKNNLIASVNLINNCIEYNVKKIIFTSSMAVYGSGKTPFKESQMPNPVDPYGIAKYTVEMDLKQAYDQFGLKYNIVRPHNVIGIRQNIWDKYRNVIGIWIRQALAGKDITIYGDGRQKRAFSDIKYCMKPFEKLMTLSNCETFNIGADKEYEIIEAAKIFQKIAEKIGLNPKIVHLEKRHEVKDAYSNHDKAKRILGFKDQTNIEKTIREMLVWAMKEPVRKEKKMKYEIEKGMYNFWK